LREWLLMRVYGGASGLARRKRETGFVFVQRVRVQLWNEEAKVKKQSLGDVEKLRETFVVAFGAWKSD
jgi:hypothetical protein